MKKMNLFTTILLAGVLILAAGPAMSQDMTDTMPEQDGTHLVQSTSNKKRALLFILTVLVIRSQADTGRTGEVAGQGDGVMKAQ